MTMLSVGRNVSSISELRAVAGWLSGKKVSISGLKVSLVVPRVSPTKIRTLNKIQIIRFLIIHDAM